MLLRSKMAITNSQRFPWKFILINWSGKAFKDTVVNRELPSLHWRSLEITLTVPLNYCVFVLTCWKLDLCQERFICHEFKSFTYFQSFDINQFSNLLNILWKILETKLRYICLKKYELEFNDLCRPFNVFCAMLQKFKVLPFTPWQKFCNIY